MSTSPPQSNDAASEASLMTARFASMVIQNTNMALIFLGQTPNPQTGETVRDLDHARYFIDQLEMLEAKTKGNLDKSEDALLKQSLTSLRLAFVESVNNPAPATQTRPASAASPATPAASPSEAPATDEQETPVAEPFLPGEKTAPAASSAEADSRKKFSKKY